MRNVLYHLAPKPHDLAYCFLSHLGIRVGSNRGAYDGPGRWYSLPWCLFRVTTELYCTRTQVDIGCKFPSGKER